MSRRQAPQDSLELFLDTICNMFGGFIFIMLFVVVSMRATTDKAYEETVAEERASAVELAELEIELETLQGQWDAVSDRVEQAREIIQGLGSQEVAQFHHETLDVLDELREASESNAAKTRTVAEIERRAIELDVEIKEALADLDDAAKKLQAAEDDAAAARKLATRKASPPQMRDDYGYRREVGVILKYGRLYFWHKFDDRGNKKLNAEDFHIVDEDGTSARTEPKPWRGVDLTAPGVIGRLDAAFAPYGPKNDTIAVVVASDSYEEYATLRDYLKDRTFRIRPIVGEKGTKVFDRGGSNAQSQ